MEHALGDVVVSVADMGGSDSLIITSHLKWSSRESGASSRRVGVDFVHGAGKQRWLGLMDWSLICYHMRWVCDRVFRQVILIKQVQGDISELQS